MNFAFALKLRRIRTEKYHLSRKAVISYKAGCSVSSPAKNQAPNLPVDWLWRPNVSLKHVCSVCHFWNLGGRIYVICSIFPHLRHFRSRVITKTIEFFLWCHFRCDVNTSCKQGSHLQICVLWKWFRTISLWIGYIWTSQEDPGFKATHTLCKTFIAYE